MPSAVTQHPVGRGKAIIAVKWSSLLVSVRCRAEVCHVAQVLPLYTFRSGTLRFSYAQIIPIFEVFSSLCALFGAYLAWYLGSLARSTPQAIGALGWLLFSYQLVGMCVSWIALSGLVRLLTLILAICVGRAAWLSSGVHAKSAATD